MKLATIQYAHPNLGNDIQTVAAESLLPRVDLRLDKMQLFQAKSNEPIALVCNGYFASSILKQGRRMWPLPANVRPLYVGFHAADRAIVDGIVQTAFDWPVGCRSLYTLRLLRENAVRCCWSGCLTLLLQPPSQPRSNGVVIADVPKRHLPQIPPDIRKHAQFVTHHLRETDPKKRLVCARKQLSVYASAELVITSRLHAMLPCAAFGTPVVLIKPLGVDAVRRFSGYEHLAWTPKNAPWDKPYPRLSASFVHASAAAARLSIELFLDSIES